jgi:hypothetical protein
VLKGAQPIRVGLGLGVREGVPLLYYSATSGLASDASALLACRAAIAFDSSASIAAASVLRPEVARVVGSGFAPPQALGLGTTDQVTNDQRPRMWVR